MTELAMISTGKIRANVSTGRVEMKIEDGKVESAKVDMRKITVIVSITKTEG